MSLEQRLYVGGLTNSITDADLTQLFSAYGKVLSSEIILDAGKKISMVHTKYIL
jgi:RNA recognition motif-containing protein